MKKLVVFICLIFITTTGCTTTTEVINITPIKAAICPVSSRQETYLFNLDKDGVLEVSFGTRNPIHIKNDNFIDPSIVKRKKLNNKELKSLSMLINDVHNRQTVSTESSDARFGGRDFVIFVGNKLFIFSEIDYTNDCLGKLMSKLIEYSPVKIEGTRFF